MPKAKENKDLNPEKEPEVEQPVAPEEELEQSELEGMPELPRYFIVNPSGAVHEVTHEHFDELIKQEGYRAATDKEIQGENR